MSNEGFPVHDARLQTLLAHLGREPSEQHGFVNPAIQRGSTVLFDTIEECEDAHDIDYLNGPYTYGLLGTPVERQLERALAILDKGEGAVLFGSGLAAVTTPLTANLKAGDHLLMTDTCYWPTRQFCDDQLSRLGIETTYYDPIIGADIEQLMRPNTRVLFMESPGSRTFEVQDVPGMTKVAQSKNVVSIVDNTWATPLLFRPIEHGVDFVIHALSKYVGGHSDLMLGAVVAKTREQWDLLKKTTMDFGHGCSPDDAWLGLRGLRSLGVRLARSGESSMTVGAWLKDRPEVARVLHPAFDSCPGHELWKRDFDGTAGVFSILLEPMERSAIKRVVEAFRYFKMGYSWGGYESLVLPFDPTEDRTDASNVHLGAGLRLSIGLEDPADLISDLEHGFAQA